MENIDWGLVDWSRAQFALTAMYHWIFVPLTLGLSFIIAMMETIYVKTGNLEWKKVTKFWMTIFGINFAIGVATGIILEFEFGTNWSNYSWFVGDIFGAPLAIEGIMAFFMESTFIAIMFFGWNKVSKNIHLLSTWLVAIGSNLSALWILVANGWMQNPSGMTFNPETVRNEMNNFWDVLFNPAAINKFIHTISSAYVLASIFVIGVSAWYILKNRELFLAKRSIILASVFGFFAIIFTIGTGDGSAKVIARYQPMKLAAMEGLYEGQTNAPLVAFGFFGSKDENQPNMEKFAFSVKIPSALSFLAFFNSDAFVPGIKDLVHGNKEQNILSYEERIEKGKIAIDALLAYKNAKKTNEIELAESSLKLFNDNFEHFGYGYYFGKDPHLLVPNVKISFYSFHIMVILGVFFLLLFILTFYFGFKNKLENKKWLLWLSLWTIPLAYIASEAGWVVAEVGRQPWVIQDLMPNIAAVSQLDQSSVQITFFLFLAIFTALLIAEIKILLTQIRKGSHNEEIVESINEGGNK
ncbi:MAG: cytochrome ubiquinol oxidase subunit I [Bacteroidales bacterium]|nr:cytochrome ubiquinol oxidase subunit I [Bacteroidales bacterium]MBN2758444.1 cytochrome ubiquinol oxidase subunit I [Bacteroidales bacterium]